MPNGKSLHEEYKRMLNINKFTLGVSQQHAITKALTIEAKIEALQFMIPHAKDENFVKNQIIRLERELSRMTKTTHKNFIRTLISQTRKGELFQFE